VYGWVPEICFNDEEQLELLDDLIVFYEKIPWNHKKEETLRFHLDNPYYSYSDAVILFLLMMHLKPKNIIEIGSGYSSALMLDVNELFFNNSISLKYLEPYPERLKTLLSMKDRNTVEIIEKKAQDIPLKIFSELKENDILFIDSSHISKVNSDVNQYIFNIFPVLNNGVYIHIHDINYRFEYGLEHHIEGKNLNEAYLLRAFLQYNSSFKIILCNSYLKKFYKEKFIKNMPLCNTGNGSIWLKKVG